MRKTFVLFFLINTISFLGQVSGYVLSNDTRKPIPYANLCNVEGVVVAYADEHGKFELTDLKFSMPLVVTSVGYEKEVLTFDKIPDTIFLSPKIINLAEVVIFKKKNIRSVKIGTTEGKIALINDFTELPKAGLWTVAKYFPPDRLYEEMPFLKKVKIRTYCDVSDTFFTIRFYSIGEKGMPDGLLYDKGITEEVKKVIVY